MKLRRNRGGVMQATLLLTALAMAAFAGNSLLARAALAPGAGQIDAGSFTAIRLLSGALALAVLSGVVTSGLGYAIWYRALPGLSTTQAAAVQLTVPILAAA